MKFLESTMLQGPLLFECNMEGVIAIYMNNVDNH
jgi:hypothetical protein